jgi:Tol biopolymer transport system component
MFKKSNILFAILTIFMVTLACANPLGGSAPANVETIVAATLQALTSTPVPDTGVMPPDSSPDLLPHSMYFLNNDAGLAQVYRLEKDGKTVTQITFEPANVDNYDVSRIDGSVV